MELIIIIISGFIAGFVMYFLGKSNGASDAKKEQAEKTSQVFKKQRDIAPISSDGDFVSRMRALRKRMSGSDSND